MASLTSAENSAAVATPIAVHTILSDILEADADADSTFGSEGGGSSVNYGSVTSSIYNYRQENGRTYHAYSDGKYLIPNDEIEQERMDIAYHALFVLFEGKAFFAPVKSPQRILDMGTGTGIWALDVGDEYLEAHVIGVDLSPIQPKWTAQNVEFRIDDLEKPWVFDSPFDLIHSRVCSGAAIRSWPAYLEECFKHLRPGGWVEAQESSIDVRSDDGSLKEDSKILQFHNLLHEGMMIAGRNLRQTASEVKTYMKEAGFVNITVKEWKGPISPWTKDKRYKEVGAYAMLSMMEGISGVGMAVFMRILGWDRVRFELFISEVKKEWLQRGIHAYWPIYTVYGQKPIDKKENDELVVEFGLDGEV